MLRISQTESAERVTIQLEGRLIGPWVSEVERLAARLAADHRAVTIELARLDFLGAEGAAVLRELARHDVHLVNASPFVMEILYK